MFKNIEDYLKSKQKQINKLNPKPILLEWMNLPSEEMKKSLTIIDKQVGELLQKQGGIKKLEQWFLSGDENFNAITAERYIINYLKRENINIVDHLEANGIDAYLKLDSNTIGIEITTLNKDIVDWILIEKLKELLEKKNFLSNQGLEITYSQKRVWTEIQGKRIYKYIADVGESIITNAPDIKSRFEISINYQNRFPGGIAWKCVDNAEFIWFDLITDELSRKLQSEGKKNQFKKYPNNIVFVGLNHSAQSNGIFPRIFNNHDDLQEIEDYWASEMSKLTNVIGICYFFYSINTENPFYPLKIFWRSQEDKLTITI